MQETPVVSFIIVNFNSKNVLKDCLASIIKSQFQFPFEVVVIDNASDESISNLSEEYSSFCFIQNTQNYGFAFANNIGIQKSSGKYILLLNPDTIVNSNSFKPMVTYLEEHNDVAIVGCKIYNSKGDIEHSTHSFPSLLKEFIHANEFLKTLIGYNSKIGRIFQKYFKSFESYWDHDSIREVDHVTGACMMIRRNAIVEVGLLDEAFFLYNEEVEWSYRMKQAGYKTVFLPYSNIIHFFGYSTKQQVQKQVINKLLIERYRGMFYFFQKHYSLIRLLMLRLIVAEGFALRLILQNIRMLYPSNNRDKLLQETRCLWKIFILAFSMHFDWRNAA
jgi:GT2 family glycosyltransferase